MQRHPSFRSPSRYTQTNHIESSRTANNTFFWTNTLTKWIHFHTHQTDTHIEWRPAGRNSYINIDVVTLVNARKVDGGEMLEVTTFIKTTAPVCRHWMTSVTWKSIAIIFALVIDLVFSPSCTLYHMNIWAISVYVRIVCAVHCMRVFDWLKWI